LKTTSTIRPIAALCDHHHLAAATSLISRLQRQLPAATGNNDREELPAAEVTYSDSDLQRASDLGQLAAASTTATSTATDDSKRQSVATMTATSSNTYT